MVRLFKQFFLLIVAALTVQRASGYALNGPEEFYQIPLLFYQNGDLGGPHMLGQEYRRNTPVIYYTYDETFLNFFGSNGVAAVEEAIAAYNAITNVSTYSADLYEFPLEATSYNYKAQALNLTDLKTYTMSILAEQLGLSQPERFTWTLRDRDVGPGGCPTDVSYNVTKRNFDPITSTTDQLQTSSYVNGTLYSYQILELCATPFSADAVEFPVDPLANSFTSVAGFNNALSLGSYLNGLTRDDVAGIRYLLRTNNINIENAGAGTITFITNNAPQLLFTSNLNEFISAALTNDAAALVGLFPNLQIVSTTPIFTNVVTTNFFPVLIYHPGDPYGTTRPSIVSVISTNVTTWFSHTFANVYITPTLQLSGNLAISSVPGHVSISNLVNVLTTNISINACPVGSPYTGLPCTNITSNPVWISGGFGDYFILPTNFCSVSLISTQLVLAITMTNATIVATNASGTTNITNDVFSQTPTYVFNQYVYVVNPVTCPVDYTDRRQGIDRVRFVRYDGAYDPIFDRYNFPITNQYTLTAMPVTNPVPILQTVRRPVLRPDILFSAMDLAAEQSIGIRNGTLAITGFGAFDIFRDISFIRSNQLPNTVGPGTIAPGSEIIFNSVGPFYVNFTPSNLDELNQVPLFAWGSYDGSTNPPVVYPNGTSIENYELSKFVNVTPNYLPQGYVTASPVNTNYYSAQMQVTSYTANFTPPVTWQIAPFPTSPGGLPPGLTISTLNATTGLISGTPTQAATFDFVVRLTDSQGRTLDHSFFIQVNP